MSPIAHQGTTRRFPAAGRSEAPAHASQKLPVLRRTRQSLHNGLPQLAQYPSAMRWGWTAHFTVAPCAAGAAPPEAA